MIGTHGANTPMDLIQLLLAETMWGWQFKPAKIDDHLLLYGGLLHHFSWWNISCFYVFSGKLHMIHHNVQILLIMTHVCIYLIIYIHVVWMVKTILMIIITIWISIKLYICTIGDAIPQRLPRRKPRGEIYVAEPTDPPRLKWSSSRATWPWSELLGWHKTKCFLRGNNE
jgi:hypothetical protein